MDQLLEDTELPKPMFKNRGLKRSNIRKRPPTPVASDSSDYSDEEGHKLKRQRKTTGVAIIPTTNIRARGDELEVPQYIADRSSQIESNNDATKQSNWFDEAKPENMTAQNLLGTTRLRSDIVKETALDGTYKGTSNYQNFIQKNPNAPLKQVGPIKAPTNIRTITVTDFAPDVCKDYKQTGFCGFGDSCKFLHAREDYKQGWQLDKDWETVTKGKKLAGKTVASVNRDKAAEDDEGSDVDDAMLKAIPFACIICKQPYKHPIVTKCGHYFCENCALQRYKKSPSCAACGAGTGGVFNGAKNLRRLLDRKKERARKRREKAVQNGEDVSEDEEEEKSDD